MPFLGKQPSRGLVGTADIDDNAVTLGKMAHQADGSIITYGTDTAPVLLAPDTSGEVLTTKGAGALPAFDAVSAGLSFISNTDISAAATYNFTGFTAGSYEHYVFYLQNLIPVTDAVHIWCRFSSNGGSSYDAGASDYDWCIANVGSYTASFYGDVDHSDAQISLTGDGTDDNLEVGSAANEYGVSGTINLYGPHTASYTHLVGNLIIDSNSSGNTTGLFCSGKRLSAADVDGFQILFSSGNIESGTITAYGLANS